MVFWAAPGAASFLQTQYTDVETEAGQELTTEMQIPFVSSLCATPAAVLVLVTVIQIAIAEAAASLAGSP